MTEPLKTMPGYEQAPEHPPTLERDGFEEVEYSLTGPSLLPKGLVREFLRPSTNIKGAGVYLSYDSNRADVWKGTIADPASREIQAGFFTSEGFTQFRAQFERHVIAARTKPPQNPQSES